MSYQYKPNSGSLFKNQYKTEDKHPDYKGDGIVNGKEVELAGWINKKKNGEEYIGITFEDKKPKKESENREEAPPSQGEPVDVNKAIPF